MHYSIKTYQKGFIADQARIGIEVAKQFLLPTQSAAEDLERTYAKDDFDPETRLYCFKGDEMVGFLTSQIVDTDTNEPQKAKLTFPSVLPRHEKVLDLLFEEGIKILKQRGVKVVESMVSNLYGYRSALALKWNYKHLEDIAIAYRLKPKDARIKEVSTKMQTFDSENDLDNWIDLIMREYGDTKEEALEYYNSRIQPLLDLDLTVAYLIAKEENRFVAMGIAARNHINPTVVHIEGLCGPHDLRLEIGSELIRICQEYDDIEDIHIEFDPAIDENLLASFTSMGFRFAGTISWFEKVIS
ncbi:MAG: hypothetical protein ACXAD7_09115 [Candidatus Kariarchaeaceae archaeon]